LKKLTPLLTTPLVLIAFLGILSACSKEADPLPDTGDIVITKISVSDTVLKAWSDTANIIVFAKGNNLRYNWSCNHGTILGSGSSVHYMAGECCVGLNTITLAVHNDSCGLTRDIKIRITSYFFP